MIKLELPLKYVVNKKKSINYSLNDFLIPLGSKNLFSTFYLWRAKADLIARVKKLCKGLSPIEGSTPLKVELRIYRASNHRQDVDNRSIIAKFVTDTLVKCGIVGDDGFKFITELHIIDMGLDVENPRCEYFLAKANELTW